MPQQDYLQVKLLTVKARFTREGSSENSRQLQGHALLHLAWWTVTINKFHLCHEEGLAHCWLLSFI